jgi:hypothetical protein
LIKKAMKKDSVGLEASPSVAPNPQHAALVATMPPAWAIGIYAGPSPVQMFPAKGVENPVLSRSDVTDVPASFVADPFMIRSGDGWQMFFEVKNILTRKGEIGLASSVNGLDWTYSRIVLAESFHLSYPYVFEFEHNYYMVPETLEARRIRLYRAVCFPTGWLHVADLVDGTFADPSIFRFEGRWWLLACPSPFTHDVLRLFFADELFGPWVEHPKSPIIENSPHVARPAGRVVSADGRVIRYAQDCYPKYGTRVRAFEILELSPTSYREEESKHGPVLTPGEGGWNGQGMHHLDPHLNAAGDWIACVDGRPLL